MKKRIWGFFRPKSIYMFLSLCALFFLFPSCDDDNGRGGGKQGFLSLTVSSDTQYKPVSRADYTDPEDAGEYMIYILQGEEIVESFPYGEAPDELPLETGTYQVKATWGEHVPAAFEALYMEGVESFSVKENEVTSVTVTAAPANAAVIINYDDELAEVYPAGYYVEMSTQYTTEPFLYEQEETRPAYFMAGTDEKMNLEMFFSTEKNDYVFTDSFLFNPCDSVVVKVRLQDEEEVEEKPTLSVSPTFYQFTAESTQSINIRVTTNCDDFTYTKVGSWYTITEGNATLIVTPQRNTSSNARAGFIMITAMKGNKSISSEVSLIQLNTQTGETEKAYIFGNPNMLKNDKFVEEVINIQTNSSSWSYDIIDEPEWLTVERESKTLLISSNSTNYDDEERTAQIALSATLNGSTARDTITVIQTVTVDPPFISVEKDGVEKKEISLNSDGVETITLDVNTNVSDWEISIPVSADWLNYTKNDHSITFKADPIDSEASRKTDATFTATAKNGQSVSYILNVTQGGLSKPKLQVTITVDGKVIASSVLDGYEVENPLDAIKNPTINCYGFENFMAGSYNINIKRGEARSQFITVRAPREIAACELLPGAGGAYNLLLEGNPSKVICSMNTSKTQGIIYLANFLNSELLSSSTNLYTLKVTDKENVSESIMLIIDVKD